VKCECVVEKNKCVRKSFTSIPSTKIKHTHLLSAEFLVLLSVQLNLDFTQLVELFQFFQTADGVPPTPPSLAALRAKIRSQVRDGIRRKRGGRYEFGEL